MSTSPTNPHATLAVAVASALDSSEAGLSASVAAARLAEHGPNALPDGKSDGVVVVFARQFLNPLIYVLVVAAVISVALGHADDAIFIGLVLLGNAVIGTVQEAGAERSARALRQLTPLHALVRRGGREEDVEAVSLVPGDLVVLGSGDRVPADVRLLVAHDFAVDESLLTGESLPVHKDADADVAADAPVGDRLTMAFAGSLVTRGRATGLVVATAMQTELGRIADTVLGRESTATPLVIRMEAFTTRLSLVLVVAVAVLGAIYAWQGRPLAEVALLAVAIGVSAIPEGLPVAITVAMAIASRRMARRNVIVRRLPAVEALGSCTAVATDKTGTLTQNRMTVERIALPDGAILSLEGTVPAPDGRVIDLLRAGVAANEAHDVDIGQQAYAGDAVDVALLVVPHVFSTSRAALLEGWTLVDHMPYESDLGYAASAHSNGTSARISVKGALEQVLPRCVSMREAEQLVPVDVARINVQASALAADGFRVLALASGALDASLERLDASALHDLEFLGLVGMIDPLRPDSAGAVAACQSAGIRVIMVTGDHPVTALAIARQLGFAETAADVVSGPALSAMTPAARDEAVLTAAVFARVSPAQKLDIVEALQRQGHFVAVTGDGANDAPALKAAHVGVAMGKAGTEVAREASDLILADDHFASIVAGVEEGRVAYATVRKIIQLLIATAIAEVLIFVLCIVSGLEIPLSAVQLLWLNLVTNGIQDVALGFEPAEGDELRRRPRSPHEPIFDRLMVERVLVSGVTMAVVSVGLYGWALGSGMDVAAARNEMLLLLVMFENLMVGCVRSETKSVFAISPFRNPALLVGTAGAQALHIVAMHVPVLAGVLEIQPVSVSEWLVLGALALSLLAVVEVHKGLWHLRMRAAPAA